MRRLETRLKEHKEASLRGEQEKSAVADHAWSSHHPILWNRSGQSGPGLTDILGNTSSIYYVKFSGYQKKVSYDARLNITNCRASVIWPDQLNLASNTSGLVVDHSATPSNSEL